MFHRRPPAPERKEQQVYSRLTTWKTVTDLENEMVYTRQTIAKYLIRLYRKKRLQKKTVGNRVYYKKR